MMTVLMHGSLMAADSSAVELEIHLGASEPGELRAATADAPVAQPMTVLSAKPGIQMPARQRAPQLSEDHLVVSAFDAEGREIYRQIILDPRLVRAELTDSGELGGAREYYLDEVMFSVILPEDPRIAEIRLLKPEWTGSAFLLNPVASAAMP